MIKFKKNKIIMKFLSIALMFISLISSTSGAYIYAKEDIKFKNKLSTSAIDILVEEYELSKTGNEIKWVNDETIMPNKEISYILKIKNKGEDCYLRVGAKVDLKYNLSLKDFIGVSDNWIYNDKEDAYYLKDIFKHDEEIVFCEGIKIPIDFENSDKEKEFDFEVIVEALQSKNIKLNKINDWGNVEIIKNKKGSKNVEINSLKPIQKEKMEIVYENMSDVVSNKEDFFSNFPLLLPGDIYSDTITFSNTGNKNIPIYFSVQAIDDDLLLDNIYITITKEIKEIDDTTRKEINEINNKDKEKFDNKHEKNDMPLVEIKDKLPPMSNIDLNKIPVDLKKDEVLVYHGTLRGNELNNEIELGMLLAKSDDAKFNFTISVPSNLDNTYAIEDGSVQWVFSTISKGENITKNNPEDTEKTEDAPGSKNDSDNNKEKIVSNSETVSKVNNLVKEKEDMIQNNVDKIETGEERIYNLNYLGLGLIIFGIISGIIGVILNKKYVISQ